MKDTYTSLVSMLSRAEGNAGYGDDVRTGAVIRLYKEADLLVHMQEAKRLLCFYRVQTRDNAITIMELGIGTGLASFDTLTYDCASSLPEWMQRKLAVLTTLPYDVPTEELENIGRRVSQHVFWVYPSAGETVDKLGGVQGGTNTRTKSKGRRKKAT